LPATVVVPGAETRGTRLLSDEKIQALVEQHDAAKSWLATAARPAACK